MQETAIIEFPRSSPIFTLDATRQPSASRESRFPYKRDSGDYTRNQPDDASLEYRRSNRRHLYSLYMTGPLQIHRINRVYRVR